MRRLSVLLATSSLALVALPAAAGPASVSTAEELAAAFAAGDAPITLDADITVDEPLVWTGSTTLSIVGGGHTITAASGFDVSSFDALVLVADGADVDLDGLHLVGTDAFDMFTPGGFSGLRVDVPADATGTVHVAMTDSSIENVGLHGLYVEDQALASAASVHLELHGVEVVDAGVGGFDEDGVRVNEGGDGDIVFHATDSTFDGAGADGVELDERGPGDVLFDVTGSTFVENGDYCSDRLDGEIEIELDTEAEALAVRAAYEDPTCVEVEEDDGVWVAALDLDDGFDIDEAGDGSIVGTFDDGVVVDNFDEGLDFDEEDAGGIEARATDTLVDGNVDEGIKYSEEGNGSVLGVTSGITADGNEDDVEYEEAGNGSLVGSVSDSELDDVKLTEEDNGSLVVRIVDVPLLDDIEAEQTGRGQGSVRVRDSDYDDLELDGVTLR